MGLAPHHLFFQKVIICTFDIVGAVACFSIFFNTPFIYEFMTANTVAPVRAFMSADAKNRPHREMVKPRHVVNNVEIINTRHILIRIPTFVTTHDYAPRKCSR